MNTPIVVDHLTCSYGKRRSVIDLSFEVRAGEVFGFLAERSRQLDNDPAADGTDPTEGVAAPAGASTR